MEIILGIGIGVLVGLVMGLLGAGGGLIIIPALIFLLNFTPHNAATTSLIIVGITAGTALFSKRMYINWQIGLIFSLFSSLGAIFGSRANILVSDLTLSYSFSVLLIGIAGLMIWRSYKNEQNTRILNTAEKMTPPKINWVALLLLATLTGMLTGFFGIGGGIIIVPVFILFLDFSFVYASATSLFVIALTAGFSLISRIGTPFNINLKIILLFTASAIVGMQLSGKINHKIPEKVLRYTFAGLLLIIATITVIHNMCTTFF